MTKQWIENKAKEGYTREDLYNSHDEYLADGGGCNYASYRREVRRYTQADCEKINKREETRDSIEVDISLGYRPKTTTEWAKACNVDENTFYPDKIITNHWGTDANPNWQFKVVWKRRFIGLSPQSAYEVFTDLCKSIQFVTRETDYKPNDLTIELQIPDLHWGQQSWGDETGGGHYDIKIAKQEYLKAIYHFYDRYHKSVEKWILPIGSDFFNVNSALGETSNGTRQDEDDRLKKTFGMAAETMIEAISLLANVAPVELIQVPGNHDVDQVWYLMYALDFFYKKDKGVLTDLSPNDRKYRLVYDTLVGFAHGKTRGARLKMQDLPLIMADEAPDLWAKSKVREYHIGHLHKEAKMSVGLTDEFRGVIVRICPSLAQMDYYTSSSGWRSTRTAQSFEYTREGLHGIGYYRA
jgi:hypothetical protein